MQICIANDISLHFFKFARTQTRARTMAFKIVFFCPLAQSAAKQLATGTLYVD